MPPSSADERHQHENQRPETAMARGETSPRAPVPPRAGGMAERDQGAQDRERIESDQECGQRHAEKHSRSAAPPRGYTVGRRSPGRSPILLRTRDVPSQICSARCRHAHDSVSPPLALIAACAARSARAATRAIWSSRRRSRDQQPATQSQPAAPDTTPKPAAVGHDAEFAARFRRALRPASA